MNERRDPGPMEGLKKQIGWKLQQTHVGESDTWVVRMLYPHMMRLGLSRLDRKELYRHALSVHHKNIHQYFWVMGGLK